MVPADDNDGRAAMRRCQEGDISGLDALVMRYQNTAVHLAYLLTQNQAVAEDIAQDSFLLVYQRRQQFHAEAPFAPWFHRIVLNTARQHLRTMERRKEISLDSLPSVASSTLQAPSTTDPVEQVELAERRTATLEILQAMTLNQRESLVLRYYCNYTDAEIAHILNVPPGTARWRLYSAIRAFARIARRSHPWLTEQGQYRSHKPHERHENALATILLQTEGETSL